MKENQKYYKIGEISKLYKIGVDSIRYYEEVGILTPKRDPNNNYRLYTLDDIRKITMIRELLSLDFSMEEIKYFEENRTVDITLQILEKELNIINDKIVNLIQQKNNLQSKLSGIRNGLIKKNNDKIQLLDLYERPCIMISDTNIPDNLVNYSLSEYMKVHTQKVDTIGACDCYTLDIENSNPESKYYRTKNVFFYSENMNYHSNYSLPAGKYLSLFYIGSPERTKELLPTMYKYAETHKLKVISDPIEICHIDNYETSDINEFVTELQLPVSNF